jgi:hypothetical protein
VWAARSITDISFLALLGTLSLARLLWLRPLADELWDCHRDRGMTLFIASIACAVLPLGDASEDRCSALRSAIASMKAVELNSAELPWAQGVIALAS